MYEIMTNYTFHQHVPIPCVVTRCDNHCCERTFCPLVLSFAKTIDTFQGLNAGPVDPGKPPNAVQRIICDPGSRQFETSNKPGLFYTIISRATTLGSVSQDGLRHNSAIYFYDFGYGKGPLTVERVENLRCSPQTRQPYRRIKARDKWMNFLESQSHDGNMKPDEVEQIFQWAESTRITSTQLDSIIYSNDWRSKAYH